VYISLITYLLGWHGYTNTKRCIYATLVLKGLRICQ